MRYTSLLAAVALVSGACATARPDATSSVDISGRWVGAWKGVGVANITRSEPAAAEFVQEGKRGHGRFRLSGSNAAEVPSAMTLAGDLGVPVVLSVHGSTVRVRHAMTSRLVAAEFKVDGDRMVGRLLDSPAPVQIQLVRAGTAGKTSSDKRLDEVQTELTRERDRVADLEAQVMEARSLAEKAVSAAEMASSAAGDAQARAVEALAKSGDRPTDAQPSAAPTPVAAAAPSPGEREHRRDLVSTLEVGFAFDKWELDDKAQTALLDIVDKLKTNPSLMADLEGYTDSIGTRVYNLDLSQRRVNSVHRYLVQKGVPLTQIHVVGLGAIPGPGSKEEQAGKRRVTLRLMSIVN